MATAAEVMDMIERGEVRSIDVAVGSGSVQHIYHVDGQWFELTLEVVAEEDSQRIKEAWPDAWADIHGV